MNEVCLAIHILSYWPSSNLSLGSH